MEEVPCRTSLVPLAFPCLVLCFIGVETEGLLDYQGRAGIISIVRWNLRPVIFGVDLCWGPLRFFMCVSSNPHDWIETSAGILDWGLRESFSNKASSEDYPHPKASQACSGQFETCQRNSDPPPAPTRKIY